MKKNVIFLGFIIIGFFIFAKGYGATMEKTYNLLPIPESVDIRDGRYSLDSLFTINVEGVESDRIYKAVSRTFSRLRGRTGLFLKPAYITAKSDKMKAGMTVEVTRPGKVALGEDESYTLEIEVKGILLKAVTDIGAIRGLETFLQLLQTDESGYFFPAIFIKDKPRFQWRGLMIDACRHFISMETIKRNLDAMAAVKMNVFHWHLSEDQGFRVECKAFPKLHQMGSDGNYYTHEQIREIVQYADERGIRVLPEFDVPGHATSWLTAYPEYASAPGPYKIEREWGIFDPAFNPANEETYRFLSQVFKEMAALFPDEYFHIGGDENNGKHWDANLEIQKFMKENNIPDNLALQSYFNNRLLKILNSLNKKMIGWDEILHEDMPTNIVIHSWRGRESMIKAAKQGYKTILSNGYYIDLMQPTDFHYLNDPAPLDIALDENQKKLIMGGEATMWSEFVSDETIDSRIWPRTAVIAERLWSPESIKDVKDMYKRLEIISFQLEELGLLHIKNQEMLMRRLTNNQNTAPLKTLIDVIEPVKIYNRNAQRTHFSYSPLTRVVDAALADAAVARKFRENTDIWIESGFSDDPAKKEMKKILSVWEINHQQLLPVIKQSPILWEIKTLSADLSKCAKICLEAIQFIENNKTVTAQWKTNAADVLNQAKKPQAQTELMAVSAFEKLVKATGKN